MLTLGEIYSGQSTAISVEIFPPKTPDGDQALFDTLDRLAVFQPDFVSCTYGAGGSTRDRTIELCREIHSTNSSRVDPTQVRCAVVANW